MTTRLASSIKNAFLSVFCLTFVSSCNFFGKGSSVEAGWLGIGNGTPTISLDNDDSTFLNWRDSSSVLGSTLDPTINGDCKNGITVVNVFVDSTLKLAAPCSSSRFSAALTGSNAFSANGTYQIEFFGITDSQNSPSIVRSYEVNYINPDTLISFNSFPTTSIYGSEDLSATCNYPLNVTIAGNHLTCGTGSIITESQTLSVGSNAILVTWYDEYHNTGTRTFTITRNPAGSTDVTVGMKSSARYGSIALQNITSGQPLMAPILEHASSTGTKNGITGADIPLSFTPSSGANGLKLNIGNHSFIFCERQSVSGECTP